MSCTTLGRILTACALVSFIGCLVFVVLYNRWYSWWRSEAGRNLFFVSAALGMLDATWTVALIVDPMETTRPQYFLITGYIFQIIMIWWRVSILVHVYRRDTSSRDPDTPPSIKAPV